MKPYKHLWHPILDCGMMILNLSSVERRTAMHAPAHQTEIEGGYGCE